MIGALLFLMFLGLLLAGVPIGVALGLGGAIAIGLANYDTQLFGLLAAPQNFYASIAKYPLLALPLFVLVGTIFDRSGMAGKMVAFATAALGRGSGMLPLVAIGVAMVVGGVSGSGPACAAAVGGVMIVAMSRAGYPAPFSASVIGAAAATDILIPPSIAFIIYSVLVPEASVPAMFAAGVLPGILAGLSLMLPAFWLSRKHHFGLREASLPRPPFWRSFAEAAWGLAAPVLILGGMRAGWFTPTEAAAAAVFYCLVVGMVIHRTIKLRDLSGIFREAAGISAVIMLVLGLAGIFAYSVNTLGLADPVARLLIGSGLSSPVVLALLAVVLLIAGMFLDGVTIFLIFVPLLLPIAQGLKWDMVWFGVLMTMFVAIGQFTPPMAVNLMVAAKMAGVPIESTLPWVSWLIASFLAAAILVAMEPGLALWLPRLLGY